MKNLAIFKRLTAFTCAVILLISTIPFVAFAGLSSNVSNPDGALLKPTCNLSVMSFNILDWDTHNTGYASNSTRLNYVVSTINEYQPDIIGVQEASSPTSSNGNYNWVSNLTNALSDTYAYRTLTNDNSSYTMQIGNGLIIFWKKSRFTRQSSAAVQYTNITYSSSTASKTDTSRYYQYVKLKDNTYNTYLYMFNTHLSINPNLDSNNSETSDEERYAGKVLRTKQMRQLSAKMKELATDLPCFATGDYNCTYEDSNSDSTAADAQHTVMYTNTPFRTSGAVAHYNHPTTYTGWIDHCYVNTNYSDVIARDGVYRDYNGYQPSDHRAVMTYTNYRANATYSENAAYDSVEKMLTDTTDSTSYAIPVTLATNKFTYKIYNENNSVVTSPVTLTKPNNTFTIKYSNGTAMTSSTGIYSTVTVKVRCTAFSSPGAITCAAAQSAVYHADTNAYYVSLAADTSSVTASVTGGTFYTTSACSTTQSFPMSVSTGRTTKYVKIGSSVYPVYFQRESITADVSVLYVDSSLSSVENTKYGSYYDHNGVRSVIVGNNGFGTISAAISKASNGTTICVAPGTYTGNVSIPANKRLTLYGNNADVSPISRSGNVWSLNTSRRAETIIKNGTFSISQSTTTGSADIHGFAFYGTTNYGPIYSNMSGDTKTTQYNISKNIFSGVATNTINGSQIQLNNNTQKAGLIQDNYLGPSNAHLGYAVRSLTFRNSNGLIIDNNYFFKSPLIYNNSEISNLSTSPGNNVITFSYNRFEDCGTFSNYTQNVTSATRADIRFLYNDFIRCGYSTGSYAITVNMNASSATGAPTMDFSKISVLVFGNRFLHCRYGIGITRSLSDMTGDARDASIEVHNNRFIQTNQFNANREIRIAGYVGTDDSVKLEVPNWSFTHNYFQSNANSSKMTADHYFDIVTVNSTTNNYTKNAELNPYFSNIGLSTLSSGSLSTISGVSVKQNTYTYDGSPKSLQLNLPEGSIVSYSSDNTIFSSVCPTRVNAGSTTIYYQVEAVGKKTLTGSSKLTVKGSTLTGVTMGNKTATYSGSAYSLSISGLRSGDTVSYSYNGNVTSTMPSFTEVGSYTVNATVTRTNYEPLELTGTLTITGGTLTGVSVPNMTVSYDGTPHALTVTGLQSGDNVVYKYAGVNYDTMPSFTDVGSYLVSVTVNRPNYKQLTVKGTMTINAGTLTGITLTDADITYDRNEHTLVFTGALPSDTVTYSVNGTLYESIPYFSDVGTYHFSYTVLRDNYNPLTVTGTMVIDGIPLTGVTMESETTVIYDGNYHTVPVDGILPTDLVSFSSDGTNFSAAAPKIRDIGDHNIWIKIERDNFIPLVLNGVLHIVGGPSPIFATGFEGPYDEAEHSVTLFGIMPGDVLTWSTDGENFTSEQPFFTDVGVYKVWVKITRSSLTPVTTSATVAISSMPVAPLFRLDNIETTVEKMVSPADRYSIFWKFSLNGTDAFEDASTLSDIRVLSYGTVYSDSIDTLSSYLYDRTHDKDIDGYNVVTFEYMSSDIGISRLTSTFSYKINRVKAAKSRAIAAYILYELDGEIYEEFSSVCAATTILDGYIGGIGPTLEDIDPFVEDGDADYITGSGPMKEMNDGLDD